MFIVDLLNYLAQVSAGGRWWLGAGLLLGSGLISLLFAMPFLGEAISRPTAAILGICFFVVLLLAGMHVGIVMILTGFLGFAYVAGLGPGLSVIGSSPFATVCKYGYSVIPLFILMGSFCFYSGIGRELYFSMYRWLGHLRGGLAMATVGSCAGFAAVSGSSMATVATMGTVALPEMKRYNYDPRLSTGCIAAGGTLGILIPPSITLIVYGVLTELSIGKLFLAGVIPGVLEAIFYMVTIYILCRRSPLMGPSGERANFMERLVSLKGIWGILALFILVMGGIYMGVFTAEEAGGVGAFGAFLFILGRRQLNWKSFGASLAETSKLTAMGLLLLIGATVFGYFLAVTELPFELATILAGLPVNRYIILGGIILFYLVLGCFVSILPMMVLTVPIFFPAVVALGFDLIWFGIIIVRMSEMGAITPPVGLNVFVIKGIAKDVPMYTIFRGIAPFLIADLFHVALLIAFPQIVLSLPNLMK